jgi:hypothetical protein
MSDPACLITGRVAEPKIFPSAPAPDSFIRREITVRGQSYFSRLPKY